jgi:hypothetical protein
MKTLNAVAALTLLVIICFPAAAFGHTGAANASCTGAQLSWQKFAAGSNTVNYKIVIDSTTAAQGTFVLNVAGGTQGVLTVPLTIYGTHEITVYSWWGPTGTVQGHTRPAGSPALADTTVHCAAAPTAPAPPAAAPAPAPVAAPAIAPAPAPAAINVLGERVASLPRVAVQKACGVHSARVTVAAAAMRQVRFSVAGRRAHTVNVATNARRVTTRVRLRRHGPALQLVRMRITFRNGTAAQTMTAAAHRCGQVAVLPEFTG